MAEDRFVPCLVKPYFPIPNNEPDRTSSAVRCFLTAKRKRLSIILFRAADMNASDSPANMKHKKTGLSVIARRFLLVLTMLFWQGGFMFYGAVVVPIGTRVLDSPLMQGWITRSVTNALNISGAVAILVWSWDIARSHELVKMQRLRWILWLVLLLTLGLMAWLHVRMDALLVLDEYRISDRSQFRVLHSWYLIASTVQWVASMVLMFVTIIVWRREDSARS